MPTTSYDQQNNQSRESTKPDPLTSAMLEHDLSLRYISLRARKVPKLKQPALIWLDDRAKGGRGPSSYHQEFLSALVEVAGAIFVIPNHITEDQQEKAIDAAVNTGCSLVIFTTPHCVEEWEQALEVILHTEKLSGTGQ